LAQIAEDCGYMQAGTVTERAQAMGLTLRNDGPGRRRKVCPETAAVLVALGLSHRDVAIHFKATQQAVSMALRVAA
jgi:hypothetical protein